jgi:hypothetical protein
MLEFRSLARSGLQMKESLQRLQQQWLQALVSYEYLSRHPHRNSHLRHGLYRDNLRRRLRTHHRPHIY